jgi:hypothetical protein
VDAPNHDEASSLPPAHDFCAEQAKGEKVPVDTLTKCSMSLIHCDPYDVYNTATIRAAMGAVVDARDSVRFPSLLAMGNLPPPFVTLSQPHDELDPDFGSCQDKELLDHLEGVLATESVVVKRGQHIVPLKGKSVFVRADFDAPFDACSGSVVGSPSPSMQVKKAQRNRPPNSCRVHYVSPLCSAAHASTPPSDLCATARCPLENIEMNSYDAPHACPPLYYGYRDGSPMAHLRRGRVGWGTSARAPMAMVVDNFSFACMRTTMGEPVEVAGFDHSPFSLPVQLSYLTPSHHYAHQVFDDRPQPRHLLRPQPGPPPSATIKAAATSTIEEEVLVDTTTKCSMRVLNRGVYLRRGLQEQLSARHLHLQLRRWRQLHHLRRIL